MRRNRILRMNQPANNWNEAIPIGNGRFGAMIYGGVPIEHVQLNEDSLWSGGKRDRGNPDSGRVLPEIRSLLRNGKVAEAEQLALAGMCGHPECQRHYETLGDLFVSVGLGSLPEVPTWHVARSQQAWAEYSRSLDLNEAVATTSYTVSGTRCGREYFASAPDNVIVVRFSTSSEDSLFVRARLRRLESLAPGARPVSTSHFVERVEVVDDSCVVLSGQAGAPDGISFAFGIRCLSRRGKSGRVGDILSVEATDEVVLLLAGATSVRATEGRSPTETVQATLAAAAVRSFAELRKRHVADYAALFNRSEIAVSAEADHDLDLPGRLAAVRNGAVDLDLETLYFDFGKYLLISSSRPGTLPATLQGIWNDQLLPPWDCKFTVNINTEMNYWPAEISGLPELHEPLFDLLGQVAENGKVTAARTYGARGYCLHHNTDLWGDTEPQGEYIPATFWPLAHLWLVTHVWDHYLYSPDPEFLRKHYPLLRGACEFVCDFLVEDGTGHLVTSPSVSPENSYLLSDGTRVSMCEGPAFDFQLIRAVFAAVTRAEKILGIEDGISGECEAVRKRLPDIEVGPDGRLLEWRTPVEEAEPGHRHVSHLWALFPGDRIDPDATPELCAAARKSLEHRLRHGGGKTGWSRAWVINLFAALRDGNAARTHLVHLLSSSTYPNLFDAHPPFQIDGNFGGAAGIAGMLLQSSWDAEDPATIRVLPALPDEWSSGSFRGLRARGGFTVSAVWEQGTLCSVEVGSERGGRCRLAGPGLEETVEVGAGRTWNMG